MPIPSHHDIQITPARAAKFLGALVGTLVFLHLTTLAFGIGFGHGRVLGFVPEFNLEAENNVPTYFSSLLLLTCAGLLAIIASWKSSSAGAFRRHWTALAAIFFFMSIDETACLHERLHTLLVENDLRMGGWFYFAWVVPGLILVGVFVLAYLRFFLHLGRRFKRLFLASAALYLGGALGMEIISGRHVEENGYDMVAALMSTVEESLELFGIALFIYALLSYIDAHVPEVRLQTRKLPQARKPQSADLSEEREPSRKIQMPHETRHQPQKSTLPQ